MRESAPHLKRIVTHIEPTGDQVENRPALPTGKEIVERVLQAFAEVQNPPVTVHDVSAQQTGDELAVSCHCTLDPGTTITDAHELTERMESDLRARVAHIGRVVIHVEPPHEE